MVCGSFISTNFEFFYLDLVKPSYHVDRLAVRLKKNNNKNKNKNYIFDELLEIMG